jgi:radical SAM protein with 4Fe4S-binding SPASM domain
MIFKYPENDNTCELADVDGAGQQFKNIGWSLGNMCPMHCTHCYSRITRGSKYSLNKQIVDKIIGELKQMDVETVNLGGNEPIFTNGESLDNTLLPYIIDQLHGLGIRIGITTAGPTLVEMDSHFSEHLKKVNDIDVSLDSPFKSEHERNRGKRGIYDMAMNALDICDKYSMPKTIIMCAMRWNFTPDRIDALVDLAIKKNANVRFNPLQPVEKKQYAMVLGKEQYYEGLYKILQRCMPIELSDPLWSVASNADNSISGCPCGTSSFRIHSVTEEGKIPVSPCVYLHDFKFGDLANMGIGEIINSPPFKAFLWRKQHSGSLKECMGCGVQEKCGGGCVARSYLFAKHETGCGSILNIDPYCVKSSATATSEPVTSIAENIHNLVHSNYLCTGIFYPIK